MFTLNLASFVLAMALWAPAAGLQNNTESPVQQDPPQEEPEVVTRVYSLRPLVAEARSNVTARASIALKLSDAVNEITSGVTGNFGFSQEANEVVSQVVQIITTTVDPDNWIENGGMIGTITFLPINSRLVVTHTPEVQTRVAKLIDDLQARQVVSVRAMLVRLPQDQVEAKTQIVDGVAVWQQDVVDVNVVAEVRFSGFDGQTQSASDGRTIGYFQSVQPVVAANAVAYQPQLSELQTGLTLRITPVLSEDGQTVTLEVNSQYALLGEGSTPTTRPAGESRSVDPVLPDRLAVDRSVLETALRVRVGRWVLVGTLGASRDGQATDEQPLHLLLRLDAGSAAPRNDNPPRE